MAYRIDFDTKAPLAPLGVPFFNWQGGSKAIRQICFISIGGSNRPRGALREFTLRGYTFIGNFNIIGPCHTIQIVIAI